MATFAQRLTLLRESKNLRKKDLASVLNVSPACVSQYEKSLSMPGHDILIRIAQYFHVSVDFLIGSNCRYSKTTVKPYWVSRFFCLSERIHRTVKKFFCIVCNILYFSFDIYSDRGILCIWLDV